MPEEIRVLVMNPDQAPTVTSIPNTLSAFQNVVGGYLEMVTIDPRDNLVMLVNEDGIRLGLEPNMAATQLCGMAGHIVGPAVVLRVGPEGENVPVTDEDIERLLGAAP